MNIRWVPKEVLKPESDRCPADENHVLSNTFYQLKTLENCFEKFFFSYTYMYNEPAHEIMVLITQATSDSSGEPAHLRSLARAFLVRKYGSRRRVRPKVWMAAYARLKNGFTEVEKCPNLMSWL